MGSLEEFQIDVKNLVKINKSQIERLTEFSKFHKEDSDFIVEAIINAIIEVSYKDSSFC